MTLPPLDRLASKLTDAFTLTDEPACAVPLVSVWVAFVLLFWVPFVVEDSFNETFTAKDILDTEDEFNSAEDELLVTSSGALEALAPPLVELDPTLSDAEEWFPEREDESEGPAEELRVSLLPLNVELLRAEV